MRDEREEFKGSEWGVLGDLPPEDVRGFIIGGLIALGVLVTICIWVFGAPHK